MSIREVRRRNRSPKFSYTVLGLIEEVTEYLASAQDAHLKVRRSARFAERTGVTANKQFTRGDTPLPQI